MRSIYFHDDDYCQQEVLPQNAFDFCRGQLVELAIPETTLRSSWSEQLSEVSEVYTGYGSYRETCERTSAFGVDESAMIFVDWSHDGVVTNI